jgi:hypothetical protein
MLKILPKETTTSLVKILDASSKTDSISISRGQIIPSLGEIIKVKKKFVHEGKSFMTRVTFLLEPQDHYCAIGYRSTLNGLNHQFIHVNDDDSFDICCSELQSHLTKFCEQWLKDIAEEI